MSDSYDAVLGMTYKTANEPRSKYLRGSLYPSFRRSRNFLRIFKIRLYEINQYSILKTQKMNRDVTEYPILLKK